MWCRGVRRRWVLPRARICLTRMCHVAAPHMCHSCPITAHAPVALKGVLTQCSDGQDIAKICNFGDSVITQQCAKSFKKKKKMEKGIAFPTCISVNDCICNFSPLPKESKTLKNGDVVKMCVAHRLHVPPAARPVSRAASILSSLPVSDARASCLWQ